ncbi:MAG: SDR family NAD(P)-dependent oxidoreductase [Steroidobacteraceae bacterium]
MTTKAPNLAGKTALVTGASRGIGRAISQRLAAAGATVVATARSLDKPLVLPGTLMETVALIESAGGRVIPLVRDLENPQDRDSLVAQAAERAGGLDILVNVAGFTNFCLVESMSLEIFELTVDHYFRVPFVLSKAAIPIMRAAGAGWIVNIGSGTEYMPKLPFTKFDSTMGISVYGAIKLALHRFTAGLAAELEADNIAVNMAIPNGAIKTPGGDRLNHPDGPFEPIEYLAETTLALCHLPAKERTGTVAYSIQFALDKHIPVFSLDGRTELPPLKVPLSI